MWFQNVWGYGELPKEEDKEPRGPGVELPALVGLPVSKQAAAGALDRRLWWLLLETRVVEEVFGDKKMPKKVEKAMDERLSYLS